ncbi:MAG: hypothetical protein DRJ26_03035 [Candidatus Methanomethylicota archaeon]|uniref:Energy-coupling factor transporter transmembrane protein EcfT n=1 Tax=Thermoproteota archaeon TaxID=2056631 RepID=A0A497F220_9CREN|nr:MAG: hypothetical protein DRJ26_03035 [Candidatus Verstraetearchaeota archaeon]
MLMSSYSNIPLRKFNPSTRMFMSLTIIVLLFTVSSIPAVAVLLIATLAISIVGGVGKHALKVLKIAAPMLLFAFLLWALLHNYSLFYSSSNTGFAVDFGIYMTLRLVALIVAPLIFIATTTPSELIASLESLKMPRNLVFLLGLTLRHISGIAYEYKAIKEAQTSRGVELDKGFLVKRIRNYIPVIIPLLIRSVEVADKVTLAMELKLYGKGKRTRFFTYEFKLADYVAISMSLAVLALFLYFKLAFGGI